MNRHAIYTSPLNFYMVIPSSSLLVRKYCFPSLFFLSFLFIIFSFQSLLNLLCQVLEPSNYEFFTVCFSMFFLYLPFFIFQGVFIGFARVLDGFKHRLITAWPSDQNERGFRQMLTVGTSVLQWFRDVGFVTILPMWFSFTWR